MRLYQETVGFLWFLGAMLGGMTFTLLPRRLGNYRTG